MGNIIFDSLALRLIIHQLNVRLSDFSSVEINVIETKEEEDRRKKNTKNTQKTKYVCGARSKVYMYKTGIIFDYEILFLVRVKR